MRDGGQHPAAPEGGRSERASESRQGGCRVTTDTRAVLLRHQWTQAERDVDN